MDVVYKVVNEVYDEILVKNVDFKKFYDSYKVFCGEEYFWF